MEILFSERLAQLIERIHYEDLPAEVVQMAKNCFLDWLGCVYAARDELPVRSMAEVATISKGKGHSTVIPYGERNSAPFAALVNGAAAHALELDDVHRDSVLHPASVVISAVYASGEREKVSGKSLIEAIVTGYEIMIRAGEGVGRSHYWFWHNTSTCGTFGAVAGVGKILGLTVDQYVHALGNAGSQSAGLWEFLTDGANTKLLHTGKAAMNGILAADLAKRDFTGARRIFEGERGFYRATSKDYSLDKLVEGIDDRPVRYRILSDSFKPYFLPAHPFRHRCYIGSRAQA
jgi:2-methylcitrate dehydratase PrpD